MVLNTGVIAGKKGFMRILGIILDILILIFAGAGGVLAISSGDVFRLWHFFFSTAFIYAIVSILLIILYLLEVLKTEGCMNKLDMIYHFIGGLIFFIVAIVLLIFFIIGIVECNSDSTKKNCFRYWELLVAIICGIVNGLVHLEIGRLTHRGKK